MILYFLLSGYLNKRRKKEEQFEKLVEETGYVKFFSFKSFKNSEKIIDELIFLKKQSFIL